MREALTMDQADKKAAALAQELGEGFIPRVWKGAASYHYKVEREFCPGYFLAVRPGLVEPFSATLGSTLGSWITGDGATWLEAVKNVIATAIEHAAGLSEVITGAIKSGLSHAK